MGRPSLPVGTAGKVRTYRSPSGEWFARAKYRAFDGSVREVQRHGRTKAIAERLLAEAIRDRSLMFGSGTLRSDSTVKQLADAWWDEIRLSDRSSAMAAEMTSTGLTTSILTTLSASLFFSTSLALSR